MKLKFGHGKISVGSGRKKGESPHVDFSILHDALNIGDGCENYPQDEMVIMEFGNVESVDVVLKALYKVRQSLRKDNERRTRMYRSILQSYTPF